MREKSDIHNSKAEGQLRDIKVYLENSINKLRKEEDKVCILEASLKSATSEFSLSKILSWISKVNTNDVVTMADAINGNKRITII